MSDAATITLKNEELCVACNMISSNSLINCDEKFFLQTFFGVPEEKMEFLYDESGGYSWLRWCENCFRVVKSAESICTILEKQKLRLDGLFHKIRNQIVLSERLKSEKVKIHSTYAKFLRAHIEKYENSDVLSASGRGRASSMSTDKKTGVLAGKTSQGISKTLEQPGSSSNWQQKRTNRNSDQAKATENELECFKREVDDSFLDIESDDDIRTPIYPKGAKDAIQDLLIFRKSIPMDNNGQQEQILNVGIDDLSTQHDQPTHSMEPQVAETKVKVENSKKRSRSQKNVCSPTHINAYIGRLRDRRHRDRNANDQPDNIHNPPGTESSKKESGSPMTRNREKTENLKLRKVEIRISKLGKVSRKLNESQRIGNSAHKKKSNARESEKCSQCSLCGKICLTLRGLNRHTQALHKSCIKCKSRPVSDSSKGLCLDCEANLRILKHKQSKEQCEVCQKMLSSKANLIRHFKVHTGEKPFKCQFCPKTAIQKHHMEKHEKIHHQKS